MRIVLRKDPIIEAVCDFYFVSENWDWTVPGLVYKRIGDDFPQKHQQPHVNVDLKQTPVGFVANTGSTPGRMQFWRADRTAVVQIGPDHLSVNQLRPYTGWPEYKAMIEQVLSEYEKEAPFEMIRGLALRYVNRLPMPAGKVQFEDIINTCPKVPGGDEQVWASWVQKVDIVNEELEALFSVQSGYLPELLQPASDQPTVDPKPALMLDLSFSHIGSEPVAREAVSDWLDTAHAEIETMFFKSLRDDYLKTFEPEKNHENES